MNWLLLRGLSRDQRHWGEFPRILGERVPGARVHCLDLPGTGTESARQSPASIAGIVADLRARFVKLDGGGEPWALFGVSLGGMVAMQWCADFPSDFARVVLANTSAADLSVPWRRMDLRVVPGVLGALASRDEIARQKGILRMTTRLPQDAEAISHRWAEFQSTNPTARATVLRQLFAATRFRAPRSLSVPVLVLSGGRDPFTDPECPRRIAEHFGAPLRIHPGAGHDLTLDDATWVADELRRWIDTARVRPVKNP